MTIIAKYPSTCPVCNRAIASGEQVEWERGSKARHTDCSVAADPVPAGASATPSTTSRSIALRTEGRRTYFVGDTYSVRSLLKSLGANWDADAMAWWVGNAAKAAEILAEAVKAPAQASAPRPRCCSVCGAREQFNPRGYATVRIYRSGECQDCFEERKMGY